MKKFIKIILLFGFMIGLTSCGFHMVGKKTLPPQMNLLYYQAKNPHGELEIALKNAMERSGITIVKNASQAPITLNIIASSFTHDDPNVVSSAQATTYTFTYSATFNLLGNKGKPIMAPQIVSATQTLVLNPNEDIDASPEVDTVQEQLNQEMIFKIFSVLDSSDTKDALAKHKYS